MTSVLNVDTIADKAGTGPVAFTKQYAAKVWVNFNGTGTIATRTSKNVSSLTDEGTGDYRVNLTNAFSDEPAATMSSGRNNTYYSATGNTSSIRFQAFTLGTASTNSDTTINAMSAHGDLA